MSTQASDLFLYMSAFTFPNKVHWVEFRLVRFDRKSGESTGEHLFFLPRAETTTWNLRRIRGQLLDTISQHDIGAITRFRLSLWPRMEPLPHPTHLTPKSFGPCSTKLHLHKISARYLATAFKNIRLNSGQLQSFLQSTSSISCRWLSHFCFIVSVPPFASSHTLLELGTAQNGWEIWERSGCLVPTFCSDISDALCMAFRVNSPESKYVRCCIYCQSSTR